MIKEITLTSRTYILGVFLILAIAIFNFNSVNIDDVGSEYTETKIEIDQTGSIQPYCDGATYSEVKNHKLQTIDYINIEIINLRAWNINLMSAYIDNGRIIDSKYKKNFDAIITIFFQNESICEFRSKLRINGDWIDHIKQIENGELISSLDVRLLDGHIDNITRFKLFLPESRFSNNEIFVSTILEELEFLVPRTQKVFINLNGNKTVFLFQEKIVKEMIENNFLRESSILEFNEKQIWENRLALKDNETVSKSPIFAKVNNTRWAASNTYNFTGSVKAIHKLNQTLFDSKNQYNELNFTSIQNNNNLLMFEVANIALSSEHALVNHNRKFYYNPIEDVLEPIYYDGMSDILKDGDDIENYVMKYIKSRSHKAQINKGAKLLIEKINSNPLDDKKILKILQKKGFDMDTVELSKYLKYFYNNLNLILRESSSDNSNGIASESLKLNFSELNNYTNLKIIDDKFYECSVSTEDCNDISGIETLEEITKQTKNILLGFADKPLNEIDSYKIDNVNLLGFNSPSINIDVESKKINILISNELQRILFIDGTLSNWKIEVENIEGLKNMKARVNENLLTGCTTFYNINFVDTFILSSNAFCEDNVNIMKSSGVIDKIILNNSSFDGLDLDFSKLEIKEIKIESSGNDCVDFSSGEYLIDKLNVEGCDDKGVSVGERSLVNINKYKGSNINLAIAVKDSSILYLEKFETEFTEQCISLYRKKLEFGPSKLQINNYSCSGILENYIQEGSVFENS